LSRYELFSTRDVDEARERVARIFCPHGLGISAPNTALEARHHSVLLHQDVRLNYVQYGPGVDIDPGCLRDFYLLQIPLRGSAEVMCGKQHITAHTQLASLPSPMEDLKMRWADDSPHLIVRVSKAVVNRHWEELTQTSLTCPLVFDLGVDMEDLHVAPFIHFIKYLYAAIDDAPAFAGSKMAHMAEGYLTSSMLTLLGHSHSERLTSGHQRTVLPGYVRRAMDYMHAHTQAALTLSDLCTLTGVSVRSLQNAFLTHTGESPMAYWRGIRLDRIRVELRSNGLARDMGVTELAARYGFLHMGHFSAQYRLRFGETPSQTMKAGHTRAHHL
jgi:AraC-like DNA-binding protein